MAAKHRARQVVGDLARFVARPGMLTAATIATIIITPLLSLWFALVTPHAEDLVRLQLAFTTATFTDIVSSWGPGAAEFIRMTITLDFVYPTAYALTIGGLWSRAAAGRDRDRLVTPLTAALAAGLADWIENLLGMTAIQSILDGSSPSGLLVAASAVAASIKWMLLLAAITATAANTWRKSTSRARLLAAAEAAIAVGLGASVIAALA